MRYKVGDTITIRSKEWFDKQPKDGDGDVECGERHFLLRYMCAYCGARATITFVGNDYYDLDIDDGNNSWTDEMFEPSFHLFSSERGWMDAAGCPHRSDLPPGPGDPIRIERMPSLSNDPSGADVELWRNASRAILQTEGGEDDDWIVIGDTIQVSARKKHNDLQDALRKLGEALYIDPIPWGRCHQKKHTIDLIDGDLLTIKQLNV